MLPRNPRPQPIATDQEKEQKSAGEGRQAGERAAAGDRPHPIHISWCGPVQVGFVARSSGLACG